MIVDAYSHVCPERLLDAISERHPSAEVAALRKNSYLFDGGRRLRYMDRIGVDQQVHLGHPSALDRERHERQHAVGQHHRRTRPAVDDRRAPQRRPRGTLREDQARHLLCLLG